MTNKTVGSSSHVQHYFSIVLAILALVGLTLFFISLQAPEGEASAGVFSPSMAYFQAFIFAMLLPGILFCTYLVLGLGMRSRHFRVALKIAALAMLPIFPWVTPLGIYTFWLSHRAAKEGHGHSGLDDRDQRKQHERKINV